MGAVIDTLFIIKKVLDPFFPPLVSKKSMWYRMGMSYRIIALLGVAILVVGGAGLFVRFSRPSEQSTTATVENVPYDIRVATSPSVLSVGEVGTLTFRVFRDGRLTDVEDSSRLLHVMIVSANLRDSYHTFAPRRVQAGVYEVTHTFTTAGKYRIWTEVDNTAQVERHDQYAEQIAYTEITVTGTAAGEVTIAQTEVAVDGYRARVVAPSLQAGKPTTLQIEVRTPVGELVELAEGEPFLYFMSGENFSFFRHGHGHSLPDGGAGLTTTFPVPGGYLFWTQLHVLEGREVRELQASFIVPVS